MKEQWKIKGCQSFKNFKYMYIMQTSWPTINTRKGNHTQQLTQVCFNRKNILSKNLATSMYNFDLFSTRTEVPTNFKTFKNMKL